MESLLAPPPGGDRDRGSIVLAVYWTFFAIELTVVSLRLYARLKIRAIGLDDWIMAFTMLVTLGCNIAGTLLVSAGGCRPLYYVVQDQSFNGLIKLYKLWFIAQPFALMAVAIGRTSVAVLILRILGQSKWRRRFLHFSIISTLIISSVTSILLFTRCSPSKAVWNPLMPAHCWSQKAFNDIAIFASCWNVLMDICIAILPITIFWNLHMSLKKRVGLCTLMGMGIFAGISGSVKTSKLTESVTTSIYELILWNGAEIFLIIICGCIPTLKPIYDEFARKISKTSSSSAKSPRPTYPVKILGPTKPSNTLQLSGVHFPFFAGLEAAARQNKIQTDITQISSESHLARNKNNYEEGVGPSPLNQANIAASKPTTVEDMV